MLPFVIVCTVLSFYISSYSLFLLSFIAVASSCAYICSWLLYMYVHLHSYIWHCKLVQVFLKNDKRSDMSLLVAVKIQRIENTSWKVCSHCFRVVVRLHGLWPSPHEMHTVTSRNLLRCERWALPILKSLFLLIDSLTSLPRNRIWHWWYPAPTHAAILAFFIILIL